MGSYKPREQADWKRDEEEYKDLNEIEDFVRHYSRQIRQGQLLTYIKAFHGELMNYYKWMHPYLKKAKKDKERIWVEAMLELSIRWINEGNAKRKYGYIPPNFTRAFDMLEQVELELKNLKVQMNMGVTTSKTEDYEEVGKRRMKTSAGL